MQGVHEQLKLDKSEDDSLKKVADGIATELRLICFDEFHVSDIADAMILRRFLEGLFAGGVIFVMTFNYPPDKLYPNGLQRESFLPTIALLKSKLDVLEVDSGVDYRLQTLEHLNLFHCAIDEMSDERLVKSFNAMAGSERVCGGDVNVLGRAIPAQRQVSGVIWFDFKALCDGPRSQNDYLELARAYHSVLLSGIPKMSASMSSMARCFTWLVDVFMTTRSSSLP